MATLIGFAKKFEKELRQTVSKTFMMEIGKAITDLIYRRVKAGYGVANFNQPSTRVPLKPLSPTYVDYRKGLIKFEKRKGKLVPIFPKKGEKFPSPVTGEFGKPGKSNLTLTGQMLKAISYTASYGAVKVFIADTQREDTAKAGITNADIAQKVQDDGRPFFYLTDTEVRTIQTKVFNKVRDNLRKAFF